MDGNHILGLYVSYYLARFDKIAYKNLNYGNRRQTHREIGRILSVNPNTVQNWRDEFDPLFGNRVGWYQRPLSPTRVQVCNALNDLSEPEIKLIVKKILKYKDVYDEELYSLIHFIDDRFDDKKGKFVLRVPTGIKAELFFMNYFEKYKEPHDGKLIDTRAFGCGYDFEIISNDCTFYIEVKGLSSFSGGILFTNKEWKTSMEKRNKYYVALISNVNAEPEINFIMNPYKVFNPKENFVKTIQINWSVSMGQIKKIIND